MPQSYLERFQRQPAFPTEAHRAAAEAVVDYWAMNPRVQALLLTCSCARGVAVPQSCLDIAVLLSPADLTAFEREEKTRFEAFLAGDAACVALAQSVPWSAVDFSFISGEFAPPRHDWTSGADDYELEIGNTLAWVHPLLLRGSRFEQLQAQYLPYYDEAQRAQRLQAVIKFALNNIEHIAPYAERGLYEQAFKRLYHAYEEYLQALFIARRIYPIAYDKWLHEQIVDILGEPALYEELRSLLALSSFTRRRLRERATRLRALIEQL